MNRSSGPVDCNAYDLLFSFIHRVSSLVFVGKAYCHNPVWTGAVSALPIDVEITKFLLMPFPDRLRRFIAPLIPQRSRVFRQRAAVRNLLFPPASEKTALEEEPSVMRLFVESGKDTDPDSLTARLLLLTAAAVSPFPALARKEVKLRSVANIIFNILRHPQLHTSSMAITHAVFDLCAMPEYVEPLRAEAQAMLARDNGEWQFSTIKGLRRLDSFLKESQRVNQSTFRKLECPTPKPQPPSTNLRGIQIVGFDRKVMSSIKLSDGETVLPRGASIVIPGGPMSRDSAFYNDPQDFDGLRFYRPEENGDSGPENQQQKYTGIEPGNLSWGNGRFTCPGRWYAATMIKLVLANLLLDYDISFPPGQTERPTNSKYDTEVHPNFEQNIVLRKRRGS